MTRLPAPVHPADCLIVGAAKAGTTTLFDVLAGHPQIAASAVKETRFFSRDADFCRGVEWYRTRYFRDAPPGRRRMEASPAYLTWSDKVAPRIRGAFAEGAVKLVVILRDPTARAYSHYWHRVRLGHEPLAFREAIAQEEVRLRTHWAAISTTGNGRYGYVRAGCYASRLRPFFAEFNRRDVHVLIDDDLRPDRFDASMARLAGFLGIDAEVRLRPARRNTPAAPRHAAVNTLYWRAKETVLARAYRRLVPRRLRRAAADAVFRPAPYPPMDADVERELRMRFADEVGACQHLIGRDLSAWLPR